MQQNTARQILLVEDDEDDFVLTRKMLNDTSGWSFELHWASTVEQALQALNQQAYDAMLVDYDLGARTGLEFVRDVRQNGHQLPVIMLTGRGSYEVDLQAMNAGVNDYLVKGEVTSSSLERSLRYTIEQQQAREALRRSNEELEERVRERTRELEQTNRELQAEVNERQRVAAELAEVQARLFDSVEAEQLHVAQELHDGPMQEIYSAIYELQALQGPAKEHDAGLAERLQNLQQQLQEINQELRVTAGELRPPALAPYGLEKTLRSHAEHFRQKYPDLELELELMPDRQLLAERARLALFRIYQQALMNIVRHAEATRADVRLQVEANQAVLEVRDNGRGFIVPAEWIGLVRSGHLGLVGSRERAEAVGGRFEVESAPGQGTLIRAVVPLNQQDR